MKARLGYHLVRLGGVSAAAVGLVHVCKKSATTEDQGMLDRLTARTSMLTCLARRSGLYLEAREEAGGDSHGVNDLYMGHGTKWNSNWDLREAESLVKPLKKDATEEDQAEYKKQLEEKKCKATRVILLVRHGQYNLEGQVDADRYLTDTGRKQADLTGQRLRDVLHKYLEEKKDENGNIVRPKVSITKSTMTRATQTADIIHTHLPELDIRSCDLLREGAPCPPEPPIKREDWDVSPADFFTEGARIEAAFRKYIHRADSSQTEESVDILVCHGNVIRYFVCRALQLDPRAWLRMSVLNGSVTMLAIRPSGRVSIRQLGEAGHFPPNLMTFN